MPEPQRDKGTTIVVDEERLCNIGHLIRLSPDVEIHLLPLEKATKASHYGRGGTQSVTERVETHKAISPADAGALPKGEPYSSPST